MTMIKASVYSANGNIIALQETPDLNISNLPTFSFDQIIYYTPDHQIRIFNQDGSEAYQCGNGLRALGHHLQTDLQVSIAGYIYEVYYQENTSWANLGFPKSLKPLHDFEGCYLIDLGNQHLIAPFPLNEMLIQNYYQDYNISFIKSYKNDIPIMTHERGVGITPSCGSAAAAAAYLLSQNSCFKEWNVHTKGGVIHVNITDKGICLSGAIERIR